MKILYVEDNARDAELTRRELARRAPNFSLDIAATYEQALSRLAKGHAYNLVLTDLNLPDGSGLALLAHIRQTNLPLAVVIITGQGDENSVVLALKAGADDYIIKRRDYLAHLTATLEAAWQRYQAEASRRTRPLRILYAEPDGLEIDLTYHHLARYAPHMHLETVRTRLEIFSRLAGASYDLLLLDYHPPALDALEVLKKLAQQGQLERTPVVLVTGQGDEEVALQALRFGAADYLVKHASYLYQLPAVLENAINRAALARERAALQESEARFRAVLHNTAIVVFDQDHKLRYTRVFNPNPGFSQADILGKTDADLFSPAEAASLTELKRKVLATGLVERQVIQATIGGQTFFYDLSLEPRRDAGGNIVGLACAAMDITERKRTEAAWRDSEARLKLALTAARMGVWEWNVQTNRIFCTPECLEIIGLESFDGRLETFTSLLHPQDAARMMAAATQALADHSLYEVEFRLVRPDGETRWVSNLGQASYDETGRPVRLIGIVQDITARKQAEERLRQTHAMLEALVQASPLPISVIDRAGIVQLWNPAAERTFGWSQAETVGRPADQWPQVWAQLSEEFQGVWRMNVEVRRRHKDGSLIEVEMWTAPLSDAAGETVAVMSIMADITWRKQTEAQLHYLAGLLNQVSDAIISTEPFPDFKIISWNRGAEAIYGWSAAEAVGRPIAEMVQVQWTPAERAEIRQTLAQTGQWRGEQIHRCRYGTLVNIEYNAQIVYDSAGQAVNYVTVNRDITQRKQAEARLQASQERFRQVVASISAHIYVTEVTPAGELVNRYISPNVDALTGYPPEQFMLEWSLWHTRIHPDDQAAAAAQLERLRSGQSSQTEYRFRRADESIVWLLDSGRVESEGDHQVIYGVVSDITERKQAEQALQQQAERLKILNALSKEILAARSPLAIADVTLLHLRRFIPCRRAGLYLIDREANELIKFAANADYETAVTPGLRQPFHPNFAAQLQEGQTLLVEDLHRLAQWLPVAQTLLAEGMRAYIFAPLRVQGVLIGVLNVGADRPGSLTEEHIAIVRELADQLAVAIQQARLLEQVQLGRERLEALSHQLLETQEAERRRLAYELHDEIGQTLTAIKLNLQMLSRPPERPPLPIADSISMVEHAIQQVRDLSLNLRPSLLDDLGLVATLRWFLDRQAQRSGLKIQLRVEPPQIQVPAYLNTVCFRVVQEALTNVIRHAQAQQVQVEVAEQEAGLLLLIRDDGIGFAVEESLRRAAYGHSLGLIGMQERVLLAGGRLEFDSAPGRGAEIRAYFPLDKKPAETGM